MLTTFIARCYLQILKRLAEATRISLAQSFSRNRSDRVSLERRDATVTGRGVFYETAENH
jgi:hypothetical protein